jgi:hypothetical protein
MCSHTFTLLFKKDICDHRNVSIKLLCVCVCLSSRDIIFLVRVSSFFSYFFVFSSSDKCVYIAIGIIAASIIYEVSEFLIL